MRKIIIALILVFIGVHLYSDDAGKDFINKYIILAVKKGEVNTVKMLLQQGADINTMDEKGNTLLLLSITMEYQDLFEMLLSKGADTTIADAGGRTPLLLAMYLDKVEIVKYMLAKGYAKGINVKDSMGKSPLMVAVAKGYVELVNQMIALGANTQDADNDGVTPLMYAVKLNQTEIAEILLKSNGYVKSDNKPKDPNPPGSIFADTKTIASILEKKGKIAEGDNGEDYKLLVIGRNMFFKKGK